MITVEKLHIYQRYNGDIDGFSRRNDPHKMQVITEGDWRAIENLWWRLALEKSAPVAQSFRAETSRLLSEQVTDLATANLFRELAE